MKQGDYVEIKTKDKEILAGLIMPSKEKNIISLKLDSGYNIGIEKNKISSSKLLKKESEKMQKKESSIITNPKLKTIAILHTGGTIASRVSYSTGAVSPSFSPGDLIEMFPELKDVANIKSKLIGNMFSEDLRFAHYNIMAKEIEKELQNVDGIILGHGTDTIAFTSCALAFALENLNKPVILVGAQRSSDRSSSDAAMNLLCAAQFIAKSSFNKVAVCMHENSSDEFCTILPACNIKKLHTSRRDAFKTVNSEPIARVAKNGEVSFFEKYNQKEPKEKLKLKLFKENLKIGILRSHPNLSKEEVKMFSKFNGLIIEGTGMGHTSINVVDKYTKENGLILNEIKKLAKKIPVFMSPQCIFGRVDMNVYDSGRKLIEAGVLGNYNNMTLEAAFIKLAWLLSNYTKREVNTLISENMHGELSPRIIYKEDIFK